MESAQLQGELWGRHAATWAAGMERRMAPLFQATLDALAPLAGKRLLDAGCGAGLAVELATCAADGCDAA